MQTRGDDLATTEDAAIEIPRWPKWTRRGPRRLRWTQAGIVLRAGLGIVLFATAIATSVLLPTPKNLAALQSCMSAPLPGTSALLDSGGAHYERVAYPDAADSTPLTSAFPVGLPAPSGNLLRDGADVQAAVWRRQIAEVIAAFHEGSFRGAGEAREWLVSCGSEAGFYSAAFGFKIQSFLMAATAGFAFLATSVGDAITLRRYRMASGRADEARRSSRLRTRLLLGAVCASSTLLLGFLLLSYAASRGLPDASECRVTAMNAIGDPYDAFLGGDGRPVMSYAVGVATLERIEPCSASVNLGYGRYGAWINIFFLCSFLLALDPVGDAIKRGLRATKFSISTT